MAFSLIPFVEDRLFHLADWLDLDPWVTSTPRRHRILDPVHELDRLSRQMDCVGRKVGVAGGLVPRDDAFEVKLDVSGFKPEDLNITLQDRTLTITGKQEEKSEDGSCCSSRSFSRSFVLPKNVNIDDMKSCLASDGRSLRVEAPLMAIEEKKEEPPKEVPLQIKRVETSETAKKSVSAA